MNFNFDLLGLDGTSLTFDNQPINAGKTLANQLYTSNLADPLKWNEVARKLYKGEEVMMDNSDKEKLRQFISGSTLINGIKEQLLNILDVKEQK